MALPLAVRGRFKAFGKTTGPIISLSWLMRLFEIDWRRNALYLVSNEESDGKAFWAYEPRSVQIGAAWIKSGFLGP